MALDLSRLPYRGNSRILVTHEVHATYRLVARLPTLVTFPSVSYWVDITHYHSMHDLVIRRIDIALQVTVARQWTDGGLDRLATDGITVLYPSLADTVFARMVLARTAERLAGPHAILYYLGKPRPAPSQALLAG